MSKDNRVLLHLATLGPLGHLRPGPGTWGSIAAAALAPLLFIPLPLWGRLAVLVFLFFIGSRASAVAEDRLQKKDPSQAIIDEFCGQWLVFFLAADPGPAALAAGLGLFRIMDIAKPWPIKASEKWLPGGYGVMLDDVIAGAYALIAWQILFYFL